MARVVRFHQTGGPEVLRIEEVDVAPPGPNEVQIRVKALGLNRVEPLLRAGTYIKTPTFPSRLGLEAAGVIETVGAGVSGFKGRRRRRPGDADSGCGVHRLQQVAREFAQRAVEHDDGLRRERQARSG
jgi:NADPH:quinone reductase-like Zn-dependent oxidoreductase